MILNNQPVFPSFALIDAREQSQLGISTPEIFYLDVYEDIDDLSVKDWVRLRAISRTGNENGFSEGTIWVSVVAVLSDYNAYVGTPKVSDVTIPFVDDQEFIIFHPENIYEIKFFGLDIKNEYDFQSVL